MKTQKHTAEPWIVERWIEGGVFKELTISSGPDGDEHIATVDSEKAEANAARIVACVNACAGMADPECTLKLLRTLAPYVSDDDAALTPRELRELVRDRLHDDLSHVAEPPLSEEVQHG